MLASLTTAEATVEGKVQAAPRLRPRSAERHATRVRPLSRSDNLLTWALALVLLWAPWPLGSDRPWSWSLLAVLAGGLLLAWAVTRLIDGAGPRIPWQLALAGVATALVWVWAFLQTMPLAALPFLPAEWAHPAWGWAADAGLDPAPRIGMDPAAGLESLMRLMSYAAIFWLAFALGQRAVLARRLLAVVLVAAALSAGYGLLLEALGSKWLFWNQERAYGTVTGTFINRNNFATYANLGVLVGMGFLLAELLRLGGGRSGLEIVARLIERRAGLLALVALLLTASLMSASRGGALSLALAFLLLVGLGSRLMSLRVSRLRLAVGLGVTLLLTVGAVQLMGGRAVLERMSQLDMAADTDESGGGRLAAWGVAAGLVAERPLLGHGFGSFREAFAQRRDERFSQPYDLAHDTYLEAAVELGLPATLLFCLGPVLLGVMCLKGALRRRRDQAVPAVAAAATLLVGAHALVDFSLQIPAVAVAYATLLGVGVAQARPRGREERADNLVEG